MNKEGTALLATFIARTEALAKMVKSGDCKALAVAVNAWLPADMQLSPVDVYHAIKTHADFPVPKVNVELLHARIMKIPHLFSALVNSDAQTIANELNMSPEPSEQVSLADVKAALDFKPAPKPENVVAGSAAMVGVGTQGE
jgi:hypothetical protein